MKTRVKRLLSGCGVVLLAMACLLTILEWNRRRHVTAAANSPMDGSGEVVSARELEDRYRDGDALHAFCASVKDKCDAIKNRFLGLQHTRKTRITRYDDKGTASAIAEVTYRVWFRDGAEQKQEIERRQLLGKPSYFDPDRVKIAQEDTQITGPFSNDSPPGLYQYRLEGVEELQGRRLLRIHFEPTRPTD
jgi:hypothetical protein